MKLPKLFNKQSVGSKPTHLPANLQSDGAKFKAILENIDDGVILIDDQQTIQMINPGASTICGWPVDEATGLSVSTVIKLVDNKGIPIDDSVDPIKLVFSLGQNTKSNDAILLSRNKSQVPISLKVTPVMDKNQKLTAAVAVFSNVTEQRAEEQQRADFISTASHEMRTPVAAIEGYLALALNDKVATVDSRAHEFLEKAHISTQHLGKLFQDLLTSAKAEDGRLTSHPAVIDMGQFMQQLAGDFRIIAQKKGLFMDFVTGSGNSIINAVTGEGNKKVIEPLYYVYADPDRMREVLTNLFDNAIKYTPEGKITIGLTGNDQVVQCYIKDTGPGIPATDIPHLFQKFYRVDNTATRTIGGTGLGLFICRKIVELYNGRIWAESTLGTGSCFYINLPRLTTLKAAKLQSDAASTLATV